LIHKTIASFETLGEALLAESVGILFLENNKNRFANVLNQSAGFEEKSRIKANKLFMYIFATLTPFEKVISKPTKGVVHHTTTVGVKEKGKSYCLHCKKSFKADRFFEHVFTHQATIYNCDECRESYRSAEMLERHKMRTHIAILKCFRCEFRGTVTQFHRSHMEECCGDLFVEENELTKEVIKNNNFMITDE
jgi:hypothetical protein